VKNLSINLYPALYAVMYFVYILENRKDKSLYIGYTNDLERRFIEHKKEVPEYKIIYYECYQCENYARSRERKLKYYGSAWRALKKRIGA
jgi:putative endonuclease